MEPFKVFQLRNEVIKTVRRLIWQMYIGWLRGGKRVPAGGGTLPRGRVSTCGITVIRESSVHLQSAEILCVKM